ncbi:MAG: hypothetical protein MHPSP_002552, partial [Paramarteilia canceri]
KEIDHVDDFISIMSLEQCKMLAKSLKMKIKSKINFIEDLKANLLGPKITLFTGKTQKNESIGQKHLSL